jgi:hypothetical protein
LHPYSNLTCIFSWYICIPNIIWIHQTITEKMNGNCHYQECDGQMDGRRTGRTSPYHNTSRFQRAYKKWPCRIMTRGSVLYVEIWPPVNILRGPWYCRIDGLVRFYTGEKWPLAVEYWPVSNFYVEKWPRGQYSTGVTSFRYTGNNDVSI